MYEDFSIDKFTDFSWKVDEQGIYIYVSGEVEKILGYSNEEIIGKTPFHFMEEKEAEKISKIFHEIVNKKAPIKNLENWAVSKSGNRICWLTNGMPIYDVDDNFIGYVGVDKDITQSKLLEENLKVQQELVVQQSRMAQMGEMLSMIAHQWNQPLSSISAIAIDIQLGIEFGEDLSTKEAQQLNQEKLLKKMNNIQEYIGHLSNTIYDFKNFFSPNKKQIETTLNSLCEKALTIIEPLVKVQNVCIERSCKQVYPVQTFNTEMIQVFLNIFKNILSNFEEKKIEIPMIHIYCSKNTISIEDNGGGIEDAIIDKIFEPYFTTKDENHGTGLGLYMSKIIVHEHHKGTIEVHNIKDGACFTITLPVDTKVSQGS